VKIFKLLRLVNKLHLYSFHF